MGDIFEGLVIEYGETGHCKVNITKVIEKMESSLVNLSI